tara:strand:- start:324 stop:890 length:567 start_codon:yes stop_codon:yes gene_type:complete
VQSSDSKPLGFFQKLFLLFATFALVSTLLFLKGGINTNNALNQLADNSLEPQEAFTNGKPTVLEFYADWCEACREMAPFMIDLENKYSHKINFVMLNVDNVRWQDFIDKYEVKGIPHINLFDKDSYLIGKLTGVQDQYTLIKIFESLIEGKNITELSSKTGNSSQLLRNIVDSNIELNENKISPRTHG